MLVLRVKKKEKHQINEGKKFEKCLIMSGKRKFKIKDVELSEPRQNC
jgi:hypothetical protein